DVVTAHRASWSENLVEPPGLGRDAGHVEQRNRAVARKRRAEMLHLIGRGHAFDADDRGNLPIIAGQATDDTTERTPVVELARGPSDVDAGRRPPPLLEVVAVTRRAPGERGGKRRRSAFEIRARAAHAVAIDHDPGIAVGDVLADERRHNGLIVDAGIRHQQPERLQRGDRAAFEVDHPGLLLEPMRGREVGAARICDGGNPYTPLVRRQARQLLEPFDPGFPERLGIGHNVRLAHRDEVARAEIVSDLDLMRDRPLRRLAELARPQRFFFSGEIHLRVHTRKSRWCGLSEEDSTFAAMADAISMCRVFGLILLMGLHMEMVQYAVEDRSQYEAGRDDKQETREDRVGSGKDLSSRGLQLTHWSHAGQNHRRIDVRICKRHVLEYGIAGHSDRQTGDGYYAP